MRLSTLVLTVAALAVVLLIAGRFYLSDQSFSPANHFWDGISTLTESNGAKPLYSFDGLENAVAGDTLVIVGPTTNFTADETVQVYNFVLMGGRLIVMDDYGTSDELLHKINSKITIGDLPLCQDVEFYKKASLPLINGISNESIMENVHVLALNHPVALQVTGDARSLASTTASAWLDLNDNAIVDENETFGAFPVVARESKGKGEIIVAGDADILINSMLDKGDNGVLLSNIANGGTVYVDTGHGQQMPLVASLYYTIKYNIVAQIICALIILLTGYAYTIRGRIFRRGDRGETPEEAVPDPKQSLITEMRKLPLSERELNEFDKKWQR